MRLKLPGVIFWIGAIWLLVAGEVAALPVTDHPRLWVRSSDLTALRSWATPSNPFYEQGLAPLAAQAKADMDAGLVATDSGGITWDEYPTEMYAELFAFMSLIENSPAVRANYAQRARTLLMHVMGNAVLGAAEGVPFRDPTFSTYDRSRWWGEGFALTVDWIYPSLTPADKTTIRQVFLRWARENANAETTDHNHPLPLGVVNDPILTSNSVAVRWAANNYYLAHMRSLGLMALSFDLADDPGGELTGYLEDATGAWLYVFDYLLRNDLSGGFAAEGLQYGPEALGYAAQFLLALYTAAQDDPLIWGQQVVLDGNPFWNETLPAFFHSLSPATTIYPEASWIGEVYQPAWYGDGQNYFLPDFIGLFGTLGRYYSLTGSHPSNLKALRWAEQNTPPGGSTGLYDRVAGAEVFRDAILYFLLFDPTTPAPADPRPAQPRDYFAAGMGKLLSRTGWNVDDTWFTYSLGWIQIDHQQADGNQFEFYRNGEWLTQSRVGWDASSIPCSIGRSDYHNTLALENEPSSPNMAEWLELCHLNGSQWMAGASSGDGEVLSTSLNAEFVYALGNATELYNSVYAGTTDILHASRSVVWFKPDHVVVYDRADSATSGRFKRFWLNIPNSATVNGNLSTVSTGNGQKLFVTTLLPQAASITSAPSEALPDDVANYVSMDYRIKVEDPSAPASIRFLHLLEGADGGSSAVPANLVQSLSGTGFDGTWFGDTVVLFPADLADAFSGTVYRVPEMVTRHLITGLIPAGSYSMFVSSVGSGQAEVTVEVGGSLRADTGGVLTLGFARDTDCADIIWPVTQTLTCTVNGTLQISGNNYVSTSGDLTILGSNINFMPVFRVESGGYLRIVN